METFLTVLYWWGALGVISACVVVVGVVFFGKWFFATPEENEKFCRIDDELSRREWYGR